MADLNRQQTATHLTNSARESLPFNHSGRTRMPLGETAAKNVEINSREHSHPGSYNRNDRSFIQSLWGRR